MAHDVFVSYSSKDKAIADTVVFSLENKHIRCWYAPRDVKPSENWGKAISDAIEQSKVFLVIFSGNANRSQRVLDELNFAISQELTILPFRIENLEPDGAMRLNLSSRHWLDAYDPSWEKHLIILKKTINSILEKPGGKVETDIRKTKEERGKKQQLNKLTKILVGSVIGVILLTVGWFGLSSLNNRDRQLSSLSEAETSTAQESLMAQGTISIETQTPITQEQTIDPALQYSTSDLGTPYYQTDFTQTAFDGKEWPVKDSEGQIRYRGEDDTYQFDIQAPSNSTTGLYLDGKRDFTNSIVEVGVKFLEGNGKVGIVCRTSGLNLVDGSYDRGYTANFQTTGLVTINFIRQGDNTPLNHVWYKEIKTGIFYRLRLDCIGQKLTVYEDGVKILEYQDPTIDVGGIGLNIERFGSPLDKSPGQAHMRVAFDNFKLWLPGVKIDTSTQSTSTTLDSASAIPSLTLIPPTQNPFQTTDSKSIYQTQDLGTPYYQSSFFQAAFDSRDWPVRNSNGLRLFHGEDDTYQFDLQPETPSKENTTAYYKDGNKAFVNSIVEVEAKFIEGGGGVGIVCRASYPQDTGFSLKGYMALFNKNGRTIISNFGMTNMFTFDSAIKVTGIYYRLRFDCIGNKMTVYENGLKLGEAQDNTYYSGNIGLRAEGAFRVAFDNFKLWLP